MSRTKRSAASTSSAAAALSTALAFLSSLSSAPLPASAVRRTSGLRAPTSSSSSAPVGTNSASPPSPPSAPSDRTHRELESHCCSWDLKTCDRTDWCSTNRHRCSGCGGDAWIPTSRAQDSCLAKWDECTDSRGLCCPGLSCSEQNSDYYQCLPTPPVTKSLTNEDFREGTYRITQPGVYTLKETVTFRPNPADAADDALNCCRPTTKQFQSAGGRYPDAPYSLGFFAAIAIESDGVTLDLGGHTLEQSVEHALMQRFFSLIELDRSPFIPGQGPADFGDEPSPATDVVIKNGRLGLSSHHGIHGNGNVGVTIQDVVFDGFEVAAAALNGVQNLVIKDCTATNRRDVPVLGIFSSAIFVRAFLVDALEVGAETELRVGGGPSKTLQDVYVELTASIKNVYKDVVLGSGAIDETSHPDEYALYHNPTGLPDGSALYGFLTNHLGVAVNGFPTSTSSDDGPDPSRDVQFENVTVRDLSARVDEVVALRLGAGENEGSPINDPVGAVLQLLNAHPDTGAPVTVSELGNDDEAVYVGNVVSNAQVMVAKAALEGKIEAPRSKINGAVVDFAEGKVGTRTLSELLKALGNDVDGGDVGYVCNGDVMAHVNKGVVAFKIDGAHRITMSNCAVTDAVNSGEAGSDLCGSYDTSLEAATHPGYGGATARGFSFADSHDGVVSDCEVTGLTSERGTVIAYDIHTTSGGIQLQGSTYSDLTAGAGAAAEGVGMMMSTLTPCNAMGVNMGTETHDNAVTGSCPGRPVSNGGLAVEVAVRGHGNSVVGSASGCPFLGGR